MSVPLGPEFDYKDTALKIGEIILALRRQRPTAAFDQKLLSDLERVYLDLVRRARWQSPLSRDPFPQLEETDRDR